jgi:hypothetical protein
MNEKKQLVLALTFLGVVLGLATANAVNFNTRIVTLSSATPVAIGDSTGRTKLQIKAAADNANAVYCGRSEQAPAHWYEVVKGEGPMTLEQGASEPVWCKGVATPNVVYVIEEGKLVAMTKTPTSTVTPTPTSTNTATPTETPTPTDTPTETPTAEPTPT